MQNFEADLFMMVSRPSETIRRVETLNTVLSRSRKAFWSKIGRDQVEIPQVEEDKPEAREARRGPSRAK